MFLKSEVVFGGQWSLVVVVSRRAETYTDVYNEVMTCTMLKRLLVGNFGASRLFC